MATLVGEAKVTFFEKSNQKKLKKMLRIFGCMQAGVPPAPHAHFPTGKRAACVRYAASGGAQPFAARDTPSKVNKVNENMSFQGKS